LPGTPEGRDYHKVLRDRLQKLCDRIAAEAGPFGYRVFTDRHR
jgi:epoxyqueuosine reductase